MTKDLNERQRRALINFHSSGSLLPTVDGYVYRDDGERADMRTVRALARRGLVFTPGDNYFAGRDGRIATRISITPEGDRIAEELLRERRYAP